MRSALRSSKSAGISDVFVPMIFCDFDGTFTVSDVGGTLAERYIKEKRLELSRAFRARELDAWQYAVKLFHDFEFSSAKLDLFLAEIELDPGARALLDWCRSEGAEFRILSDGFDYNIEKLRQMHQLVFDFSANHLSFRENRWCISPGLRNADCDCGTGNCKRLQIENERANQSESLFIYIGNGRVSDRCGAEACDLVFAKETLADALHERGVAYTPFETLNDVVAILDVDFTSPRKGGDPSEAAR